MSGLKINKDKTKAIWIGSRINSTEILCREHNLDWEQGPIKILGVTFSPEVFNIWNINSQNTFAKIEKIIKIWSQSLSHTFTVLAPVELRFIPI